MLVQWTVIYLTDIAIQVLNNRALVLNRLV